MSEPDDIVTRDDDLELQNSRDRLPGGEEGGTFVAMDGRLNHRRSALIDAL